MIRDYLVSVIIPIYKVEEYICECVESVLNQSYENLEIILVDDGSPDKCPDICNEYKKIDRRVKVIHKKNGGLSDARNTGIKTATGDYILFLDGDDFYNDKEAIERLVKHLSESEVDVLNFSYTKFYENENKKTTYFSNNINVDESRNGKKEQLEYMTKHGLYIASACNKMIKKSLLDETMTFRKGVYSEDIEWCAKLLIKAETIDYICENFYYYRQRKESIRYTIDEKKCKDLCDNIIHCFELLDECTIEMKEYLCRYISFQYGTFFIVQAQAEEVPANYIEKLGSYKWILKYHAGNKKLLCLYIGCKIVGYKNLCRMIRLVYGKK